MWSLVPGFAIGVVSTAYPGDGAVRRKSGRYGGIHDEAGAWPKLRWDGMLAAERSCGSLPSASTRRHRAFTTQVLTGRREAVIFTPGVLIYNRGGCHLMFRGFQVELPQSQASFDCKTVHISICQLISNRPGSCHIFLWTKRPRAYYLHVHRRYHGYPHLVLDSSWQRPPHRPLRATWYSKKIKSCRIIIPSKRQRNQPGDAPA